MTGISQVHSSSQRDAGLRRLRWSNRMLAAATVVLTLVFANAAARAFPGHARVTKVAPRTAPSSRGSTTGTSAARPAQHHPRRRRTVPSPALRPPASPPQAATSASATAAVVSGGS